ncbi:helix-turn-helix domain-containing protein [Streptomyces chumphonensis]|uniref:Helix-turn-helix domain-containing protein n=1 Tax=Streptomyces chumphonensis TaxID=1214925 RepID=A0A927IDJ9_9ACTN|nr:PucR family transcriptional regulator [Streptomyces chumphonensis]MBD3933197.1 helix-turn-helix domain-containing protein [Streptomyces chumphonensis]
MTEATGRALFRRVLHDLASDTGVVEEIVAAARRHSPAVARLPESENRRHIAVLLAAALASAGGPPAPGEQDFTAATLLGRDRAAQGVPITALLRGVQAGRGRATEIAVERGRAAGVAPEAVIGALLDFDRYAGAMELHVIDGYHTAQLELARTARDARTQVLRRLLHGDRRTADGAGSPDAVDPDELERAGLRPDRPYHCVLSDVTDPVRAQALEGRLASSGGAFGLVEGRLAGLAARLPTAAAVGADALVVVAPAAPLSRARHMHALCDAGLRALGGQGPAGARTTGLHRLTDLAVEIALDAQPRLAELLCRDLLGALDPADAFHRELALTARAYFDHGMRQDQTAAVLHVHPNTVRYRLGRLAALTGTLPEAADPGARPSLLTGLHWHWALRTWLGEARRTD